MKKILLSIAVVFTAATTNAQVTAYSASSAADFAAWAIVDADQDGFNWSVINVSTFAAQGEMFASFSYNNADTVAGVPIPAVALTPDNWAVTPAINLTGQTTATLSWVRAALDPNWVAENYSVYVVQATPATLVATLVAATPVYTETINAAGVLGRYVDISSVANMNNVYVAFRHHNCTDNFAIILDDVKITNVAGVEENSMEVSVYPNPATDVLNIQLAENVSSVSVLGMDGKVISTQVVNANTATVNVSNLVSGVYFYEVVAENGTIVRNTFVKK
jgi:hypothetical protein